MKLQMQPEHSRTCGQHAIAMLLGRPVGRVIDVIGRGGTGYTKLRRAVEALKPGYTLSDCIQRRRGYVDYPISRPANRGKWVARINFSRKPHWSHFVALQNGIIYDPGAVRPMLFREWLYAQRARLNDQTLQLASWARIVKKDCPS